MKDDYNKPVERISRILFRECELYATPSNLNLIGICSCGGRITFYLVGKKLGEPNAITCRACGRFEVVRKHG